MADATYEEQIKDFLEHSGLELMHVGVKGMRWGHRKASSSGSSGSSSSGKSRKELKTLDKASKKKDIEARDKQIDAARARYDKSARTNYLKAKAQYKIDKNTIGKREAKKVFQKVKDKNMADADIAIQAKSGKETRNAILSTVGLVGLAVVAQALANS